MRMIRSFLIGLFLTIVGIAALMLIPSKQLEAPMPWEVTIMPDGNRHVFGIHLGTSNYGEAQQQLRQYGKTAIFTQEGVASSVEAYFNSINLGGLSAKLVLNLDVDENDIEHMLSRALEARLQTSGAHRYELANEDNINLVKAPIIAITYIPTVRLNADKVRYRFGPADSIVKDADNPATEIWHYDTIGLTIRMNDSEKTILEYHLD